MRGGAVQFQTPGSVSGEMWQSVFNSSGFERELAMRQLDSMADDQPAVPSSEAVSTPNPMDIRDLERRRTMVR